MSQNKKIFLILVLIISSIKTELCDMGKLIFDKTTNSNKGQPPIKALIGVDTKGFHKDKSVRDLYCNFTVEKSLMNIPFSDGPFKIFYRFDCHYKIDDSGYKSTENEFRKYDFNIEEMEDIFLRGKSFKHDIIIQKKKEIVPELYQIYLENAYLDNFEDDIILDSSVSYPQEAVMAYKDSHPDKFRKSILLI